ncbi:hypothetical protein [Ancylobacter lacus]|uniref:hypothetical protein n=1 Tax=Ancylobacter lacus TaxID=2579970 RepID=UPI001BCABBCE|nr:hypothetical protein [Ancylobacter lacus]MBS7540774.1 hypothetical protein [Ancylobacter lacus]
MEVVYPIGILLRLVALVYATMQSRKRRQAKDRVLPEGRVDEVARERSDVL